MASACHRVAHMEPAGDLLREVPIFGALSPKRFAFCANGPSRPGSVREKSFFREGDAGDAVFVLEEGTVEVLKSRRGIAVVRAALERGACFGDMVLVAISSNSRCSR